MYKARQAQLERRMKEKMRPAVLSISQERILSPIRNAVLAHAGYGVIPVTTAESALKILHARHVCALIIGHSLRAGERYLLCAEAQKLGVPSVVLDPYDELPAVPNEVHVNPLDGPEIFLDALSSLVGRGHQFCVARHH